MEQTLFFDVLHSSLFESIGYGSVLRLLFVQLVLLYSNSLAAFCRCLRVTFDSFIRYQALFNVLPGAD